MNTKNITAHSFAFICLIILFYYQIRYCYHIILIDFDNLNDNTIGIAFLQMPLRDLFIQFFFMTIGGIGTFYFYQKIKEEKLIYNKVKNIDRVYLSSFLITISLALLCFITLLFKSILFQFFQS